MQVKLISTGALGDTVMLTALGASLHEAGERVTVVSPVRFASIFLHNQDIFRCIQQSSEDAESVAVDLQHCYSMMPHDGRLRSDGTRIFPHLVEWMAAAAAEQMPSLANALNSVNCSGVKVALTEEELSLAEARLKKARRVRGGEAIVLFTTTALSGNRSVPASTLKELSYEFGTDVTFGHLIGPNMRLPAFEDAVALETPDPRQLAALAVMADAVIVCDSGPLHVINGGLQFARQMAIAEQKSCRSDKVIVVTGSSRHHTVAYEGNRRCSDDQFCSIAPCGAHGYASLTEYEARFERQFFAQSLTKRSGCIFPEYAELGVSPCMRIRPESIAQAVRSALA